MTQHPLRSAPSARPDVLICAGLDPSGGAGILADVRVVSELGCRPVGVVTALTVQNTTAVLATEAMAPDLVREQLEFLLSDVEVKAVKIGMIGSSEVAKAIAEALALTHAAVVWDPIVQPSRGDVRFVDSLFGHAVQALSPHLTLLTPNASELAFVAGTEISSVADAIAVGVRLAARLRTSVLVKGGHLVGTESGTESNNESNNESIDVLCHGDAVDLLRGPRTQGGEHVHGTGCALSSAIAAYLALGAELVEACRAAKVYVAGRIASPARPGRGAAAVV
jgi:hydroxymethylpyrimidine/phosphomethylpyrimidine kinase